MVVGMVNGSQLGTSWWRYGFRQSQHASPSTPVANQYGVKSRPRLLLRKRSEVLHLRLENFKEFMGQIDFFTSGTHVFDPSFTLEIADIQPMMDMRHRRTSTALSG